MHGSAASQHATPEWAVIPFVAYLLVIAVMPLLFSRLWESNLTKLCMALAAAVPIAFYLLAISADGPSMLLRTAADYVAFMTLLGALYVISGGICLRGSLVGTPRVNTSFLLVGSVLASLIGTTGASALLIRPLLRANERRARATHIVVFFIFIVSNGAGLLTPLGDPPLFLGFLRGVPFSWTLRLAPTWAVVNGSLLALFALIDVAASRLERRQGTSARPPISSAAREPLHLDGAINVLWLLGIVGVVFATGALGERLARLPQLRTLIQVGGMALFAGLSWRTTGREVRQANRFSWAPVVEVAAIFLGVFVTMIPALSYLEEHGATLGITQPWQFFWASGALSSVLDNAPTYLTFASLAVGVTDAGSGTLAAGGLGALAAHPDGRQLLTAVSCGAVLMGAITYIGNAPNFMVKAIAEQHRVHMPSFFGYIAWSLAILLPVFVIVSSMFF